MSRPRLIALLAAASAGFVAYKTLRRHNLDFFYAGKVVVVTGSTRGLGLVIARELLAQSATVVICGRDKTTLDKARLQLLEAGDAELLALPCDVRDPDEVRNLVSEVLSHYGRIDVLINNAGTIQVGPLANMTDADFADAFRIHFWAQYHTSRTVLPHMQARRAGRIINITSIGGRVAVPHMLPYSAGKFAAYGFSRGLQSEVAADGISVTTVVPGLLRTGSPRNADFKGDAAKEYTWFAISDSLPVMSMDAKRAARAILDAGARRDVELTLTLAAKLGIVADAIAPELSGFLSQAAAEFLPESDEANQESHKGREVETPVTRSPLTVLT